MDNRILVTRPPENSIWRLVACGGLLAVLPVMIGCGNGLARVTGTVTVDGKPAAARSDVRGTVTFYRERGGGAPAIGILDRQGQYSLSTGSSEGAAPGPYLVAISLTRVVPPKQPGGMPLGQPIGPRRYANPAESGLRAEVQPGRNTFDFSLDTTSTR